MTRREQKRFVRELCKGIADDMIKHAHNWPKDWDGHELRMLVAERAEYRAELSGIHKWPHTQRAQDFENILRTRNL